MYVSCFKVLLNIGYNWQCENCFGVEFVVQEFCVYV